MSDTDPTETELDVVTLGSERRRDFDCLRFRCRLRLERPTAVDANVEGREPAFEADDAGQSFGRNKGCAGLRKIEKNNGHA